MQEKTSPKRFVAGAVCPKCQAMDTTVCFYEDELFVRECTECDFHEKIGHDEEKEAESKPQIIKVKEL
ncbi:MAG TPA: YheV family putative zinc ribbon protein [Kangiella sp.]|uniref:YheV family putative zinc ribbon protein n=1 Tax=Kangiella sp. TaxID=1920245 RepID=UPI002F9415C6